MWNNKIEQHESVNDNLFTYPLILLISKSLYRRA